MPKYLKIEGEENYVKDDNGSHGIINNNVNAYNLAKKRAGEAQRQKDEMRETAREINTLKSEMHEIKNLLQQLVKES
jgi:t-SNARE complex subunit (syntaxin)